MAVPTRELAASLQNLLAVYRLALELANSRKSLSLRSLDDIAWDCFSNLEDLQNGGLEDSQNGGQTIPDESSRVDTAVDHSLFAKWFDAHSKRFFLLRSELPFLRYLLHRHIKTRVAVLRRAYARRASTQGKSDQFSVEREDLQRMDEAVPTRIAPWKLWAGFVALCASTAHLGMSRTHTRLRAQDWAILDKLRERIADAGKIGFGLILILKQGSIALLLFILYPILFLVWLGLLFVRYAFLSKRILLSGKFCVISEETLEGLAKVPGSSLKIPAARDPRGAYGLERMLFENLNERLPTETPLDLYSSVFAVASYLIFWTFTYVVTPPAEVTGANTLLGQIAAYLLQSAVNITPALHHGVRTWRRWRARKAETPLVLAGFWNFWKTWVESPLFLMPLAAGFILMWVATPRAEMTGQNTLLGQIAVYLIQSALFITPALHHGVRTWRRWRARKAKTPLVLAGFWKTWVKSPLFWVPPLAGYILIYVATPPAEMTGQNTLLGQIAVYLIQGALYISPALHHGVRTWRRWRARKAKTPLVLAGFWKTWVKSPLFWVPLSQVSS